MILATGMYAQTIGNEAFPQLKDGLLDLNLRTPGQKLRFGGYLQGSGYYTDIKNAESEYGFDIEHAYLSLEGSFLNEKLGFFYRQILQIPTLCWMHGFRMLPGNS